jgi:hypothetical protein
MDDFEQQLKRAMARQEPPPWFEAKVLAAAERQTEVQQSWFTRFRVQPAMRWATGVVAALLVTTGVWQHEHAIQQRAAGEAAKEKLKVALRITGQKLHNIQERVDAVTEGDQ